MSATAARGGRRAVESEDTEGMVGNLIKKEEAVPGALVWVRRPNGSWWPGRVMAMEDLPAGCPTPPRSGGSIPIILLGRDDGTIDWYNLDRSKRVKLFRCGEFDDVIEKAKASTASARKNEDRKYVRKEEAILHALEIEGTHFCDGSRLSLGTSGSGLRRRSNARAVCGKLMNARKKQQFHGFQDLTMVSDIKSLASQLLHSVVSYEQGNHSHVNGIKFVTNESEDDVGEGMQRMRNLREIGFETKKKGAGSDCRKLTTVCDADAITFGEEDPDYGLLGANQMNGRKPSHTHVGFKRKRSNIVKSCEISRRKYQHDSPSKVCEDPVVNCRLDPILGHFVQRSDDAASDKLKSATVNGSSPVAASAVEEAVENMCWSPQEAGGEGDDQAKDSELSSLSSLLENDFSDGIFNDPLFVGDIFHSDYHEEIESFGSEKFQPPPAENAAGSEILLVKPNDETTESERLHNSTSKRKMHSSLCEQNSCGCSCGCKVPDAERGLLIRKNAAVLPQHTCTEPAEEIGDEPCHPVLVEMSSSVQKALKCSKRQSWKSVSSVLYELVLYDVALGVEASYKGLPAPLVSLMSRSNGKAVVGHPISVEILDDGFCHQLITGSRLQQGTISVNRPSSKQGKPPVHLQEKGKALKRGGREKNNRNITGKLWKKGSHRSRKPACSPRKMRKLSSITSSRQNGLLPMVQKVSGMAEACIPLNLVYGRIIKALTAPVRSLPEAAMAELPHTGRAAEMAVL